MSEKCSNLTYTVPEKIKKILSPPLILRSNVSRGKILLPGKLGIRVLAISKDIRGKTLLYM
jgi:hypothetical protein